MSAAKMKPPVCKKNTPKARGKHAGSKKNFTNYKKIEREPTYGKSGFFSRKDKTLKKLRKDVKNSILTEDMHNSSLINKVVRSFWKLVRFRKIKQKVLSPHFSPRVICDIKRFQNT